MASIALYSKGACLVHNRVVASRSGGGKRGKLEGKVSAASFRRLRSWCIKHDINSDCWGLTLTVPGVELLKVDDFKVIHHKLCVWANDNNVPLVWRVELQQRGQPHLHCVLFGDIGLAMKCCLHWYRLLDNIPPVINVEQIIPGKNDLVLVSRAFLNGSQYACDLQKLSGDFRSWRYLVAHMAKRKQVQLGWCGRNWGVCNRRLFHNEDALNVDLCDSDFYRVRRWVRRLTRSRAFRGNAFILCNPLTIKRMLEFCEGVPF